MRLFLKLDHGFIDYLVKDEMGRGIALEFKPLFEADVELDKSGKPILKRVKQRKLKPENYASQVLKYIRTEFTVDDRRKLELIIGVINKFIFIQNLDGYGVIEFNWIRSVGVIMSRCGREKVSLWF
ncbi:MAG: hypothetical protein ACTSUS_09450 [Candidatus Freyarchaeota archaeon]